MSHQRRVSTAMALGLILGLGLMAPVWSQVQRVPNSASPITIGDSALFDAFARLRTSGPVTLFDSKLIGIDDAPLFWDEALESGAGITASTPTAAKPYIDLTSSDTTAGVFTRQTFRRFAYQPGKSQLIMATGVLELSSGTLTGVERRIGLFDDDNGLFFESDAGVIGVTTRSNDTASPVDTTVVQASWDDPADGTGACRCVVDFSQAQIFVLDFQWLSIGRVRFGVELDGQIMYLHEVAFANTSTVPWASTPNLPVRYQLITTGSSGVAAMRIICSTVISEGGTDATGMVRHVSTAGAAVDSAVENTLYALVGLRLKADHLGTDFELLAVQVQVQTNSELVEWVICHNPTVADTFTYANVANSSLQRALGATANTVTCGTEVDAGYLESGTAGFGAGGIRAATRSDLRLGAAIDGTLDTVVLAFRPIGGVSAASVEGGLTWRERL